VSETSPDAFALATAVVPSEHDPSSYRGRIEEGWDIAGNANGGYLLAIAGRAISHATGLPDLVTVTGHFLAPGRPGEVGIDVAVHRAGRRHATATATLHADGRPLLVALGTTTSIDDALGPELVDADIPTVPSPEDCVAIEPTDGFPPPFMGRVELRLHPEDVGFSTGSRSGRPVVRGWFRLRDGEVIDSHGLVLAVDAFPPTIFNAHLPVAWTPTVELTAHLRARPSDGWLRCAFRTRFVSGGYLEADGEIWDSGHHLVAQSRQLALVPRS
jgi:acyl-CoA thioesterase